jgi:hypothetical protein
MKRSYNRKDALYTERYLDTEEYCVIGDTLCKCQMEEVRIYYFRREGDIWTQIEREMILHNNGKIGHLDTDVQELRVAEKFYPGEIDKITKDVAKYTHRWMYFFERNGEEKLKKLVEWALTSDFNPSEEAINAFSNMLASSNNSKI